MPEGLSRVAEGFDYQNPDYLAIFKERAERLSRIRTAQAQAVAEGVAPAQRPISLLKLFYRDHIAQFITDWGMTFDPRNPEIGLPSAIPFLLFKRQEEFVDWVIAHWRSQRAGLCDKSRELGVSWLTVAVGVSISVLYEGVSIGYGSRKEEYVDKIGEPKSLFWKARFFIGGLPAEFRAGHVAGRDDPYMRLVFPETGSSMGGEGGANIGRGDRRSIYIVDEAAHLEHPEQVDAALSMTTNCRIDVSSVNGRANPFAQKRFAYPPEHVFTMHWRDDPRKDEGWYAKKVAELNNPVIVAQELDINYSASVEGVLIPSEWVQAAVDAHVKLGIVPRGQKMGALDVADEGIDKNAFCGATGVLVNVLEEWSGKGGDIFATVEKAFGLCDQHGYEEFWYDADGLGAGVRGDARVINDRRKGQNRKGLLVNAFRGSGEVVDADRPIDGIPGQTRTNADYFANAKAQSWWHVRTLFLNTYRWVVEGNACSADEIISLSSKLPLLNRLMVELSQPTFTVNTAGKNVIDKKPDGAPSPNLADALMIRFARKRRPMVISDRLLAISASR